MKRGIFYLFLMIFMAACSDARLVPAEYKLYRSSRAGINFCTTRSDTIRSNLKFLFVMDRSGSNQQRYDSNLNPLPGTDPSGARRFDALIRFIQAFQEDQYVYWSMLNFASNVLGGNNFQDFTNNKNNFLNWVTDQRNRTAQIDGGGTNYIGALDRITQMIRDDVDAARNTTPLISSNYVVFFISDGEPIVNGNTQSSENVLSNVQTIAAIEEDERLLVEGVQLNTAYYYSDPVSPGARQLLNDMSLDGHGDFLEFGSGQEIDFSRFAIPIRIAKFDLKEIWVVNTNTTWHGDVLKRDSDGDGLADDFEDTLGSDPHLADSDGNGVSDGVEFRLSGGVAPCGTDDCNPSGADPFTTCRSVQLPQGSPTLYGDTDNDFLNDCEERLIGSDAMDPDSNKDYIPDHLAFINEINVIESSNASYLDPDYDNLSDYDELKFNTPLRVNNNQVPGHKMLKYNGQLVSSDSEQDCYNFNIDDLVTRAPSDIIRVYLMENTKTLNEKRIMRTAEGPMVGGSVSFSDSDFR